MLGILETNEIDEVLRHQFVGRIGCHVDETTYIVPISYAYDGQYIYGCSAEGLKIEIMRKNPNICFQVDEIKNMANWKSVIAWGKFEELTDLPARNNALQILVNRVLPLNSSELTHLSSEWPFPEKDISKISGIVFRISLKEKTGRYEDNLATSFLA